MKNLRNSKTSGISLVALIVTIIVLIILTAAVIVTFMEGGIIDRAKEAVFKSDIRTYQEILAVKKAEEQIKLATGNGGESELNATELVDIQGLIPEFKEEYKDLIVISNGEMILGSREENPYSTWLADLGIGAGSHVLGGTVATLLKVGDYVDYNITGGTYTIKEEEKGWICNDIDGDYYNDDDWSLNEWENGEEEIIYKDIMWRVLKTEENTVTLVSAEPTENILLYGKNAFLNGTSKLNEICAEVYGGRNLKLEDVNELLKIEPLPYFYDEESNKEEMELGATLGDAIKLKNWNVNGWIKPDNNYENLELLYDYSKTDCTNASEIAQKLVFTDNSYWLDFTSVRVNWGGQDADFNICFGNVSEIGTSRLTDTYGDWYGAWHGLRPVVTLSASTQVADVTGDGSSAEYPWQLK